MLKPVIFSDPSHSPIPLHRFDANRQMNQTADKVAKVFGAVAVTALAATFYAAFWFIAAPATVVMAFNVSVITTVMATAACLASLACSSLSGLQQDERPKFIVQSPPQKHISSETLKPASSEVDLSERPQPLALVVPQRRVSIQYVDELRALERERENAITVLRGKEQLLRECEQIEGKIEQITANIRILAHVKIPDGGLMKALGIEISSIKEQVQQKKKEAQRVVSFVKEEKKRIEEWQKYRSVNCFAIQQEIEKQKEQLRVANEHVQGYGAARAALKEQDKCKAKIKDLEEKLKQLAKVQGYQVDPYTAQRRWEELSQITLESQEKLLGIPLLMDTLKLKEGQMNLLEGEKNAYDRLLRLQGELAVLRQSLATKLWSYQFTSLDSLRHSYETEKMRLEKKFAARKAGLEERYRYA